MPTAISSLTEYNQIESFGFYKISEWKLNTSDNTFDDSAVGDFYILKFDSSPDFGTIIITSPRFTNYFWLGRIWNRKLCNFRKI